MAKPESVEVGSIVYFLYGFDYQLGIAGEAGVYLGPGCAVAAIDGITSRPLIPWGMVESFTVIAPHGAGLKAYYKDEYGKNLSDEGGIA